MNQQQLFPTTDEPTCPGCGHDRFRVVTTNLERCLKCNWLIKRDEYGAIETAFNFMTAGRSSKRKVTH